MSRLRTAAERLRDRARWFVRMPNLEGRVEAVDAYAHDLEDVTHDLGARSDEQRARLDQALGSAVDGQRLAGDALAGIRAHSEQLGDVERRLRRLERWAAIPVVTDWIAAAFVPEDLLISVVLPTRNRREEVPLAIQTVLAQEYRNWELVVVDDASTDDTARVVDAIGDDRIRRVEGEGRGVSAARNVGLDHAEGDVVAYLDDDNRMDRLWLKAVAWTFWQRPRAEVVYGARVIDDSGRAYGASASAIPALQFEPFDRETLEWGNFVDMGVIAHRAGLPEARFDESFVRMGDWDLFLRLTEEQDPVELPVVALRYYTGAEGRLSRPDTPVEDEDRDRVLAKVAERRRARVSRD